MIRTSAHLGYGSNTITVPDHIAGHGVKCGQGQRGLKSGHETGSNIENRLKLMGVGRREANVMTFGII